LLRPPFTAETRFGRYRDFQDIRPQPVLQERLSGTSQSPRPEGRSAGSIQVEVGQ